MISKWFNNNIGPALLDSGRIPRFYIILYHLETEKYGRLVIDRVCQQSFCAHFPPIWIVFQRVKVFEDLVGGQAEWQVMARCARRGYQIFHYKTYRFLLEWVRMFGKVDDYFQIHGGELVTQRRHAR